MRQARQQILTRDDDPLTLHLLLDESALLRPTGGPQVMLEQMDHLLHAIGELDVEIRILPLDAAVYAAAGGSFYLLSKRGGRAPFLLYTETPGGAHYIETDSVIENHVRLFRHLEGLALTPDQTVDRLLRAKDSFR